MKKNRIVELGTLRIFLMQMKNKPGGMDPSQFESGAANRSRRVNTHMLYCVLQASFNLSL